MEELLEALAIATVLLIVSLALTLFWTHWE